MKRPNLKLVFGWNMYVKKPKFKYLFSLIKKKKKKPVLKVLTLKLSFLWKYVCSNLNENE